MSKPDRARLRSIGEAAFVLKMEGRLTLEEFRRLEAEAIEASAGDAQARAFLLKYRPGGFAGSLEVLRQR